MLNRVALERKTDRADVLLDFVMHLDGLEVLAVALDNAVTGGTESSTSG
jgi:hypothetical protein